MLPAILAILFLLLVAYMRLEASWLEVVRHAGPQATGLRVAVLSDLHIVFCRIPAKRIKAIMESEKPDLILFLGDAVDRPAHIPRAADWLKTACCGIPAMAILGNHDHQLFSRHPGQLENWRKSLQLAGIRLCQNESFPYRSAGRTIRITALDDYRYGQRCLPAPPADTADSASPLHGAMLHLVMTHNPQRLATLPHAYADFAVAGHFHGGQIWMPFGLEFHLFRKEPLGKSGVRRGLHVINGTPAWLTRGVGNVLFPLRLGARPELTLLEL